MMFGVPIDHPGEEREAPAIATVEFYEFWRTQAETVGMTAYVYDLTQGVAELKRALDSGREQPDRNGGSSIDRYYRILVQLLLTRSVDAYLTYLVGILTRIFIARPETLRSESQVPVSLVLQHESMESLIRTLAEDEVNRLAYRSIRDLVKEVERRTGLVLFEDTEKALRVVELVEVRNLVVHNNGIVNKIFAKRLPQYVDQIGRPVKIADHAFDAVSILTEAAEMLDREAREKFSLDAVMVDTFFDEVDRP